MRRILSWIILPLLSVVAHYLTAFISYVPELLYILVDSQGKLVNIIFNGIDYLFMGIRAAVAVYSAAIVVHAVEAINISKRGIRYYTFAVFMMITHIIGVIQGEVIFNFWILLYYFYMIVAARNREN